MGYSKRWGSQQFQNLWESGVGFAHSHAQTSGLVTPRVFLPTSILSSAMCLPTNHPFLKPFSSLKKAIIRPRSSMPQSADISSNDLACPRSDLPILISPSSTIHAADMPVTSQIHSTLPAPQHPSLIKSILQMIRLKSLAME